MNSDLYMFFAYIMPFAMIVVFIVLVSMMGKIVKVVESKYPIQSEYYGEWLNFQTAQLNRISIKRAISIGLGQSSLYIKSAFPATKFSAEIPWVAVKSITQGRFLLSNTYLFRINKDLEINFIASKEFEKFLHSNMEAAKLLEASQLIESE
jgi:hypothetical protein